MLAIAILSVLIRRHVGSHVVLGSAQQEYTGDYEQQRGKGSFPAMITPAYQRAKRASQLASQVSVFVLITVNYANFFISVPPGFRWNSTRQCFLTEAALVGCYGDSCILVSPLSIILCAMIGLHPSNGERTMYLTPKLGQISS